MVAAQTEKTEKKAKKKRNMYGDDVRKKAVSLFLENKTPQEIVVELKKIFPGHSPAVKAVKRYIIKSGNKLVR